MTAKKHLIPNTDNMLVRPPLSNRGFTLIELLIVVAIIAILAAIAIPNFLEAQTRAKVARVKSDMRSIATALESYAVDNNKYPPNDENSAVGLGASPFRTIGGGFMAYAGRITTPIAYMSSVPHDIFDPRNPTWASSFTSDTYGWDLYEYWADYSPPFPPVTGPATFGELFPGVTKWLLFSWGPNGPHQTSAQVFGINSIYDPTNGTTSLGNIYRAGPGYNSVAGN